MNSKFQLKIFRAHLCFVIDPISTPTTPGQENRDGSSIYVRIWRTKPTKCLEFLGQLISMWIPQTLPKTFKSTTSRANGLGI